MRAILIATSMFWLAFPAFAGSNLNDMRLDHLEYESQLQRADVDAMMRQQALDEVDARDRAYHNQMDGLMRDLRRDPLADPPRLGSSLLPR